MASVNKIILIGNAGRDAETRTFPSGDQVTNVTIATTESWKDKQTGEKKESTEWHALKFSGGLAKVAADYIKKGSSIYVEGKLKSRKYTGTDQVEKTIWEVHVNELKLLGGRPDGAGAARAPAAAPAPAARNNSADMDEDIPF